MRRLSLIKILTVGIAALTILAMLVTPTMAAGPTTGGESNLLIVALVLASMLIVAGFSMRHPAPVPVRVRQDRPRQR
jgi:hypothetical protein